MPRQNDFLEGIRRGMQAFLQTRQMMQQYQGNQLQQETMKMQQSALQKQQQDYMSPEDEAAFKLSQHEKQRESDWAFKQQHAPGEEERARKNLEAKIAWSEMRVRALNKDAPGKFYVDSNGEIQESRTYGRGEKTTEPMKFKDAMASTVELFKSFGVEQPQQTPIFNRIFGYMRDENYQAAQAVLRAHQMRNAVWPEKMVIPMDFKYKLPTGEEVDPQQYTEMLAYMGKNDAELKAAFDDILKQAKASGFVPQRKMPKAPWFEQKVVPSPQAMPRESKA